MKNIYIGSDHAGYFLKTFILDNQPKLYKDYQFIDLGTHDEASCDYPDIAKSVAISVVKNEVSFGILICGSAQGMCMTANKFAQIRACIAWNSQIAKLSREHNNANVLCLPARFLKEPKEALQIITTFLNTNFSNAPRHVRRVEKVLIKVANLE